MSSKADIEKPISLVRPATAETVQAILAPAHHQQEERPDKALARFTNKALRPVRSKGVLSKALGGAIAHHGRAKKGAASLRPRAPDTNGRAFADKVKVREFVVLDAACTRRLIDQEMSAAAVERDTDNGTKNAARGLLRVERGGGEFVLHELQSWEQEAQAVLETAFEDGRIVRTEGLTTLRQRLWGTNG